MDQGVSVAAWPSVAVDPVETAVRRRYSAPRLNRLGAVREMTLSGTKGTTESSTGGGGCAAALSQKNCIVSDVRLKMNVVRIGEHPAGFGLYMFDYIPTHRDLCGHGRQFGVLAQEVERIVPQAVLTGDDGFKAVDYALLGID